MKVAVISIGRSGSNELLRILNTKNKINIIQKPDNHLYPNVLKKKYGKNIKVIFITRNIKDVIKSVLQRKKDCNINWIKNHYRNLNSNFDEFKNILEKDTMNFEKLYDSYHNQDIFDVLFIKYKNLYTNSKTNKNTLNQINKFLNIKLSPKSFVYNNKNKWSGKYNNNKDILLKWGKELQDKLDGYEFHLKFNKLEKIKIAHVISPFICKPNNPSYLYYAQPITFKSMNNAKQFAENNGISVELYAGIFEEDDGIVPEYFNKLPYLKQSTQSLFPKISGKKKLPIIQELFNLFKTYCDADYYIYTNCDIGIQKIFYKKVYDIIKNRKLKSFSINRRNDIPKFINGKRLTENDLNIIYKQLGEKHPGSDCFIMKKNVFNKINMKKIFPGYSPIGRVLKYLLKKEGGKHVIFEKLYLTFHMGKDQPYKSKNDKNDKNDKNELWLKNIEIGNKIRKKL
jgi:hypothetical protein